MNREAAYAALVDTVDAVAAEPELSNVLGTVMKVVDDVLSWDQAELLLYRAETQAFQVEAVAGRISALVQTDRPGVSREGTAAGWTFLHGRPTVRGALRRECLFSEDAAYRDHGLGRMITLPLSIGNRCLGALNIGSVDEGPVNDEDLVFLMKVARFLAFTVHLMPLVKTDSTVTTRALEDRYLETLNHRSGLVYVSAAMQQILRLAERVAPTRATVLITGESGTGKELLAHAIHDMSRRAGRPLVSVNCGALPHGLVESALFGHERGAFTGAVSRHLGCFQQAHGGTLFLDEVGELPLDVQVKLLRVLQDRCVQRVGAAQSVAVDVRIVAATNTNLERAVMEQRFRADLYHRLNVFPIEVPPLRDRPEDIAVLARHFAAEHEKEVSEDALRRLREHVWPGNVRELHNVIERAAILSDSPRLELTEGCFSMGVEVAPGPDRDGKESRRLLDIERDHIVKTLAECAWRIEGRHGAAYQLGLHPSTLRSRLKRMGIHRPFSSGTITAPF